MACQQASSILKSQGFSNAGQSIITNLGSGNLVDCHPRNGSCVLLPLIRVMCVKNNMASAGSVHLGTETVEVFESIGKLKEAFEVLRRPESLPARGNSLPDFEVSSGSVASTSSIVAFVEWYSLFCSHCEPVH